VIVGVEWLNSAGQHAKRIGKQSLCPVGRDLRHLQVGCHLLVKYRDERGSLEIDEAAQIVELGGEFFVKSEKLCACVAMVGQDDAYIGFFFEGTASEARCVCQRWDREFLRKLENADRTLRLAAYDLPPNTSTVVDAEQLKVALYATANAMDGELFARHAAAFLNVPHIVTALFAHVLSLRSEDNINFVVTLKKVAEQLRVLLLEHGKTARIERMTRSHLEMWAEAEKKRIAFLDGGVARIPSLAGLEPMALRVGIYSVEPGLRDPSLREAWSLRSYVIGDVVDKDHGITEDTDRKRLQEASRYVLEPLTALLHLRQRPETQVIFLHGPLINQFVTYNDGEPYHLPFLAPEFLEHYGIRKAEVVEAVQDLPKDNVSNQPRWNQFMAVYAYLIRTLHRHEIPMVGVVERAASRSVTKAVLNALLDDKAVKQAYVDKVTGILDRFGITDDFLFGCVLREGEYITPLEIQKNPPNRAVPQWQPVVRQYPAPHASMLKTDDGNFPFRVELNGAGVASHPFVFRLLYHTSRLLPRYAFPVGLDIADKYAKVPDWIAAGISAELSATVLKRALRTGDPQLVAQVRQLLARGPRDFFFRPTI
jgi:hypothetical protein